MSDEDNPSPDTFRSAGHLLRAAREKQGLHIAALAAAIKVNQRKLEALENDRYDELPDATFTRALAQTVCRTLKIDAKPVLDKLPAAPMATFASVEHSLNTPFRDKAGRDEPGLAAVAIKPMVWGAAVLMVAAVAVYFLPPGFFSRLTSGVAATAPGNAPATVPANGSAPAASAPLFAPSPAPTPSLQGAPAASAPAVADAAPLTAPSMAVPQPQPAASTGGETVFSAPPAAASASAPAVAGVVQLRTSEASWIEVRDARGATLLSRTVMPGEAVGLDGSLPIRLTIGNAAATQLGFRGQPVDLVSRTRDNVARVELQ